jgi:Ca2+-binding RTX toxin-like protein
MAKITYEGRTKEILRGTHAEDTFYVDLANLGNKTVSLREVGNNLDTLHIIDDTESWEPRIFININGHLTWRSADGGRIFLPLVKGEPRVEYMEWGTTANGTQQRLKIVTDLTPPTGGNIAIAGTNGADRIVVPDAGSSASGYSVVYGGNGNDSITASGSEHTVVYGGRGADLIVTNGPAAGEFYGQGGKDVLWGCSGNDRFYGGSGKDNIFGSAGSDSLYGGNGRDTLKGGNGSDLLKGGNGRDTIEGGDGSDRIAGGAHSDILTGGRGSDRFYFDGTHKEGRDVITDFSIQSEILEIKGINYADLAFGESLSGSAKIILPPGSLIILEGVDLADLSADIFDFV